MRDVEVPGWLEGLPVAPEFRPTDTEFADPIAYISKIEKEASAFGICKIIPPLRKPSRKYVVSHLNKSLSKCPELFSDLNPSDQNGLPQVDDGVVRAVFTTRQQELGQSVKRARGSVQPQPPPVQKQVWQSGEIYTLEQFESKSRAFARSVLGTNKEISSLAVEALFWKAASEKPIYLEYANDVPGSAFGEPLGLFRYFHRRRRRRRRCFRRNAPVQVDRKKHEMDTVKISQHNCNKAVSTGENKPNPCLDPSKSSTCSQDVLPDETCLDVDNEMLGTAGWKLSNSPWNLQIISRSAGSLTRFMPDDIPGVTSPMVYIGMLFSWFAWHIEDHELHSLNFLHTGCPKTWYAVPGEYASAFEDVICKQAYGGNLDLLAALSLLGEKTTLLSPEVVVSAGIPCCRLIQNPGEFVVTFPRAYHIGFSHGFNCGEAANFGTPQWLKVAKEAAVRRAAMSYLPMLSHQQLLYLLTMSFSSSVPRSLLPGARSSRLRDRQKEDREQLVKKAFIEDMLNENKLASVLIGKQTTYCAALWNPDLLPSSSKDSLTPAEDDPCVHSDNDKSPNNLLDEMRLYMETVNDLYVDDADLYTDFQMDSGTLACVACGILGFPFMCILQPSSRAAMELLPVDHLSVQAQDGGTKPSKLCASDESSSVLGSVYVPGQRETERDTENSKGNGCVAASGVLGTRRDMEKLLMNGEVNGIHLSNLPPVISHDLGNSMFRHADNSLPNPVLPVLSGNIPRASIIGEGWNGSSGFFRPRIFCLEHAIQIEELLQSKGGTNLLVICHSDFQKIKPHAEVIAEETGTSFNYNNIPLENASPKDLSLINLAIDDEEHNQQGEDWTSKLGINLQYCVNTRKNSSSELSKHALRLGGLFCETNTGSEPANLKWKFRRSRSKHTLNHHHSHNEPCMSTPLKKANLLGVKLETENDSFIQTENKTKIIQYSRRRIRCKNSIPKKDPCESAIDLQAAVKSAVADSVALLCSPAMDEPVVVDMKVSCDETETDSSREVMNGTEPKEDKLLSNGYIRSPCEGLRPRTASCSYNIDRLMEDKVNAAKKVRKNGKGSHVCDLEGCGMRFETKGELLVHKGNRCPFDGCGKKFTYHKYAVLHQQVHEDRRPLKCSWEGCEMSFKWAWARTEHLRVHTGERPYRCEAEGCGRTFRYVSDFSRHRRKTGHGLD